MLTAIAGPRWSAMAEDELEMGADEGKRLIAAGYAVEAAVVGPSETATKPRPRAKRRKGKKANE